MSLKRPVQIENHRGITIRFRLLAPGGGSLRGQYWKANCFLLQYQKHIRCAMRDTNESDVRDIINALRTILAPSGGAFYFMLVLGGAGDMDRGIFLGTGTTPVEYDDYSLEAKIAQGAGAGQLDHAAGDISVVSVSADRISLTISRNFTNNSGDAITVNEIGIQCATRDNAAAYRQFLLTRDIVTDGFSIPNGQTVAASVTLFTPF